MSSKSLKRKFNTVILNKEKNRERICNHCSYLSPIEKEQEEKIMESEELAYLKKVLSDFDDYCNESGSNCWTRENILCAIEREKERLKKGEE